MITRDANDADAEIVDIAKRLVAAWADVPLAQSDLDRCEAYLDIQAKCRANVDRCRAAVSDLEYQLCRLVLGAMPELQDIAIGKSEDFIALTYRPGADTTPRRTQSNADANLNGT